MLCFGKSMALSVCTGCASHCVHECSNSSVGKRAREGCWLGFSSRHLGNRVWGSSTAIFCRRRASHVGSRGHVVHALEACFSHADSEWMLAWEPSGSHDPPFLVPKGFKSGVLPLFFSVKGLCLHNFFVGRAFWYM